MGCTWHVDPPKLPPFLSPDQLNIHGRISNQLESESSLNIASRSNIGCPVDMGWPNMELIGVIQSGFKHILEHHPLMGQLLDSGGVHALMVDGQFGQVKLLSGQSFGFLFAQDGALSLPGRHPPVNTRLQQLSKFWHNCTGTNHHTRPDFAALQQNSICSNVCTVGNLARRDDCTRVDYDVVANLDVSHTENSASNDSSVQDVAVFPYHHFATVSTDDSVVPHTATLIQGHVSNEVGRGGNELCPLVALW
eukprot:CAMPEP_0174285726 /NCGR_PEP_ID=MMETSP0809-20121228/9553_1 /TAXON_ID=73025 ORGANISM="Eutreptiella gymnastica-like, Strain CCMP1594" /NCGR_SAMPLE_ID=MMETSP0809 /ASSEMBLY_ACC=CAM_ASM_000658 /LENGTH=249 /DNA_ID=CAMNT_0015381571 /DNA_START=425 /DNA_END=1171 /DNA_ORIENTATION=-